MAIASGKEAVATPAVLPRQPDPAVSLEVDILMLDYLAHNTILACLDSHGPFSRSHNLAATNAFLSIFSHRHPEYTYDDELRFRLQLLKFTTLFTQRYSRSPSTPPTASLKHLRAKNSVRVKAGTAHGPRSPAPAPILEADDLERNRAQTLHDLGLPAEDEAYEDAFYGTSECVSLLDLLPAFLTLSALRNRISHSQVSAKWIQMAGEFTLQALLEQVLVYGIGDGKRLHEVMDEALGWGVLSQDGADHDVGSMQGKESLVEEMFMDDATGEEIQSWTETKEQIRACWQSFTVDHLSEFADAHPLRDFDGDIKEFLSALASSMPLPVLAQLETGQLDGMSKEQTAEFVRSCGLSAADFWQAPAGFKGPQGKDEEHTHGSSESRGF